jgi:hypothetical protein
VSRNVRFGPGLAVYPATTGQKRSFADVSYAYLLRRCFFGAFHQGKKAAQVANPCAEITGIRKEEFRYRFLCTPKPKSSLLTTLHPRKNAARMCLFRQIAFSLDIAFVDFKHQDSILGSFWSH